MKAEAKLIATMMEALIRQLQNNKGQADKLIDEAWKEFNKRQLASVKRGQD